MTRLFVSAFAAFALATACGGGEPTNPPPRERPVNREWNSTTYRIPNTHPDGTSEYPDRITIVTGPDVYCIYYYEGLACRFDEDPR